MAHCPIPVVGIIFSFLSAPEVLHFSSSNKRIRMGLAGEAILWQRDLRDKMSRFMPAMAFFDGPTNESVTLLQGTSMADLFPGRRERASHAVSEAIVAAGLAATGVSWSMRVGAPVRRHALFEGDTSRPTLLESICRFATPGAIDMAGFRLWATTFACSVCHGGNAERQCAACGALLCFDCSFRCAVDGAPLGTNPSFDESFIIEDHPSLIDSYAAGREQDAILQVLRPPPRCAFALCWCCNSDGRDEDEVPWRDTICAGIREGEIKLFPPFCTHCPPRRFLCPAHVDLCAPSCDKCGSEVCVAHSIYGRHAQVSCHCCKYAVCEICDGLPSRRGFFLCETRSCECWCMNVCSECATSEEKCPGCGKRLHWH